MSASTGTATSVGLIAAVGMLTAGFLLTGIARSAFIAMGLTMPGLMLQDAWRYAFFAHGQGIRAFLNDLIWAAALTPALIALKITGHQTIFWFVLAWGASATVAAAIGPLQARVIPRLHHARRWITTHKDLAIRYMVEESFNSFSGQVRAYGLAFFATLAAVGAVQAASTLMGPLFVIMGGSIWSPCPRRPGCCATLPATCGCSASCWPSGCRSARAPGAAYSTPRCPGA